MTVSVGEDRSIRPSIGFTVRQESSRKQKNANVIVIDSVFCQRGGLWLETIPGTLPFRMDSVCDFRRSCKLTNENCFHGACLNLIE